MILVLKIQILIHRARGVRSLFGKESSAAESLVEGTLCFTSIFRIIGSSFTHNSIEIFYIFELTLDFCFSFLNVDGVCHSVLLLHTVSFVLHLLSGYISMGTGMFQQC